MLRKGDDLEDLMRAAVAGDAAAYRALLTKLSMALRPVVRRAAQRAGLPPADTEDIVQDVLLAIHTKRHTWDVNAPLAPWIQAMVKYKVIDAFRRRGRGQTVPIEDVEPFLSQPEEEPGPSRETLVRFVEALKGRERDVVEAISLRERSIAQTAETLSMTEGAVRVALHRGLTRLAKLYRDLAA